MNGNGDAMDQFIEWVESFAIRDQKKILGRMAVQLNLYVEDAWKIAVRERLAAASELF